MTRAHPRRIEAGRPSRPAQSPPLVMVPPVATPTVPAAVMTSIAVPAMMAVTMAAAAHLNHGIVLGRDHRGNAKPR